MLGLSPLPRTIGAALRDVRDKKLMVRVSALKDLARLCRGEHRAEAVAALSQALIEDSAPGVRGEAAVALADAEATDAIDALIEAATGDAHVRVRQMAIMAIGELADEDNRVACALLERALRDDEPALRFQALIAVGRIRKRRAEDAIVTATKDGDDHVRYVAFRLAEEHWVTEPGELPSALAEAARGALEDDASEVRLAAAILLAHAKDASGAEVLAAAVNDAHPTVEPEDEQAAIDLSGELALEQARPGLERRAFGLLGISRDRFAWQARVALARLGDQRAKDVILRGLGAWTRDARTMAVAAAGRARLSEARPLIEAMQGKADRAEPEAVAEALQLLSKS